MKRLPGPGEDSSTVEVDDAVGEHFRMHTQVAHAAPEQERADGVRHRADADLQAAAVLDLVGDQQRDGVIDVGGRRVWHLRGGPVVTLMM
jgi:hypothetical protein